MSFQKVSEIADAIGIEAALVLCGYYGGRTVYIPAVIPSDHTLVGLVGMRAAVQLARAFGDETLLIPTVDLRSQRNAGLARALARYQVPAGIIGLCLGISKKRVEQILSSNELDIELVEASNDAVEDQGAPIAKTSRGDAEPRASASSAV